MKNWARHSAGGLWPSLQDGEVARFAQAVGKGGPAAGALVSVKVGLADPFALKLVWSLIPWRRSC